MANGKTHDSITIAIAACSSMATLAATSSISSALLVGAGCLLGIFVGPDLDQESINGSEWRIVKATFGLGFLWVMFWYPYALFFKHRSFGSHFPVVSTFIRLLYLSIIPFVISLWFPGAFAILGAWIFWIFIGLSFSDLGHWVADGMPLNR